MKRHKKLIAMFAVLMIVPFAGMASPDKLSDEEMTEVTVSDNVKTPSPVTLSEGANKNGTIQTTANPVPGDEVKLNPIDTPSELNRIEESRLESQPSDQHVNDQISEIVQGLHDSGNSN